MNERSLVFNILISILDYLNTSERPAAFSALINRQNVPSAGSHIQHVNTFFILFIFR
jgi:hypothetical protein